MTHKGHWFYPLDESNSDVLGSQSWNGTAKVNPSSPYYLVTFK